MLQTTEWDLHELVRDLFERLVGGAQGEYASLGEFIELVRDEEGVALWFGAEDSNGRGARFVAQARYDEEEQELVLELLVDDSARFDFFRLTPEQKDLNGKEWLACMGNLNRDAIGRFYNCLVRNGGLEKFFYEVRTSTMPAKAG